MIGFGDAHPDVKGCCARFYGSDAIRLLLGETFHPGGAGLTLALADMLRLHACSTVLDVASGVGTSAFAIAERFGCRVVGVDLSETNVVRSNEEAAKRRLSERVEFMLGDAERLPFSAGTFDALLCECAFCTFPDKTTAASEFFRVLRPGGMLGLSDLTREAAALPELDGLLAWIACVADAQPLAEYAQRLRGAGFAIAFSSPRDECLEEMVEQIRGRILVFDVLQGLGKLERLGLDLQEAKRFADAAAGAVKAKRLGYAILVGQRPAP